MRLYPKFYNKKLLNGEIFFCFLALKVNKNFSLVQFHNRPNQKPERALCTWTKKRWDNALIARIDTFEKSWYVCKNIFTKRIGSDLTPIHAFTFPPPY